MRFKIDENLPAELAVDLHTLGHEADTVASEGLAGTDDSALISIALREGRVLLTMDKGIANLSRFPVGSHAGIVLFRPDSVGRRAVLEFARSRFSQLLEMDLRNRLTVVSATQIRVR